MGPAWGRRTKPAGRDWWRPSSTRGGADADSAPHQRCDMSSAATDRNLLFGILALQMDFVSRDALIAAMHAWVLEKTKPLGQLLLERKALDVDAHRLLESLVDKHVQLHGGDPRQSLATLSSLGGADTGLEQVTDPEVQASLQAIGDPYATRAPSVGAPTSSGTRFRILRP